MANNFTTDPACKALWRFEPGALTIDSIGANTLTPSASPPTSDTTNFKEGTGSALFTRASSQFYHIADTALCSGFPFKSGGGTTGSFCFRFRPINGGDYQRLVFKWGTSGFCFDTWGNYFRMYNGTEYRFYSGLVSGHYYTVVYTTNNSSATCYIWDETTSSLVCNWAGNVAATPLNTADLYIGSSGGTGDYYNGNMDELVVFNRQLAYSEAIAYRNQLYSGPIHEIEVGAIGVQVISTDAPSLRVGAAGVMVIYRTQGPNHCRSLTTNAPLQIYNAIPSNCRSLTTVGVCPIAPPASCKSLTTGGVAPIPPLASCKSLSRIEAIAAPLANCTSLTYVGIIPENRVGNCESLTISQPLLLAIPYLCESKTKSQSIPPFDGGLFLIL